MKTKNNTYDLEQFAADHAPFLAIVTALLFVLGLAHSPLGTNPGYRAIIFFMSMLSALAFFVRAECYCRNTSAKVLAGILSMFTIFQFLNVLF